MELNDDAKQMIERCRRIDFFRSVGQPLADPCVEPVADWHVAIKLMLSRPTENLFKVDARNAISSAAFRRNKQQSNTWNRIIDEAERVLLPEVLPKVESRILAEGKRGQLAANVVLSMLRLAVVERQLRPWHDSDFFLRLVEWLERGRLPCGATERYPKGKLLIF